MSVIIKVLFIKLLYKSKITLCNCAIVVNISMPLTTCGLMLTVVLIFITTALLLVSYCLNNSRVSCIFPYITINGYWRSTGTIKIELRSLMTILYILQESDYCYCKIATASCRQFTVKLYPMSVLLHINN